MAHDGEEDTGAAFEPLVHLEKVEVRTGEEDEAVLYKHRSRVYRFDPDCGEWKERGTGDVKLLLHRETSQVRIVLREDKTLKLRVNHPVVPGLELKPNMGSDRAWTWASVDYSEDDPKTYTFAIKFRNADVANAFKAKYEEAQEIIEGKREAPADIPDASADDAAAAEEKKDDSPWRRICPDGKLIGGVDDEKLAELWAAYDADGSKFIDASECERLVLDIVRAEIAAAGDLPVEVTEFIESKVPAVAAKVLAKFDTDKDGKISFDEFKKLSGTAFV